MPTGSHYALGLARGLGCIQVGNGDAGAVARQPFGNCRSDATRGAGNQRYTRVRQHLPACPLEWARQRG